MALLDNDLFVLQRPSVYTGGMASSDVFSITAKQIAVYCQGSVDSDYADFEKRLKKVEVEQNFVNESLLVINNTLDIYEGAIKSHSIKLGEHNQRLADIDQRISDSLARAKINIYYKLVRGISPGTGEMAVLREDPNNPGDFIEATNFTETTRFRFNVLDTDGVKAKFERIFTGETVEVTNMHRDGAALLHRAIYMITKKVTTRDYYDIDLLIRHYNGEVATLPYYDENLDNPVRSDFYPVFSISEEEVDEKVEGRFLEYNNGDQTLYHKLSINSTRSKLTLWGDSSSDIKFKNILRINNRSDGTVLQINEESLKAFYTLDMNYKKITNVSSPTDDADVVTLRYLEQSLERFDVTEDQLFKPGDRVAGSNPGSTEIHGFYVQNNSLYFKITN